MRQTLYFAGTEYPATFEKTFSGMEPFLSLPKDFDIPESIEEARSLLEESLAAVDRLQVFDRSNESEESIANYIALLNEQYLHLAQIDIFVEVEEDSIDSLEDEKGEVDSDYIEAYLADLAELDEDAEDLRIGMAVACKNIDPDFDFLNFHGNPDNSDDDGEDILSERDQKLLDIFMTSNNKHLS